MYCRTSDAPAGRVNVFFDWPCVYCVLLTPLAVMYCTATFTPAVPPLSVTGVSSAAVKSGAVLL